MVLQGYASPYANSPIYVTDYEHMPVDKLGTKLDISDSMAIKEKVELVLSEKGMTTMDLIRGIPMSKGGFYTMWEAGTITLGTLVSIARVLERPAGSLLPDRYRGEVLKKGPGERLYVEDRLELLERELRQLKNQLKHK